MNKDFDQLSERLITFAAQVGKVVDELPDTRLGRHIAGQLVRSCTSPAPNYEEARAAESRADFVHKMQIVLKELRESRCWLHLILKGNLLPDTRLATYLDESTQLCNIIGQSIVTAKANAPKGGKLFGLPFFILHFSFCTLHCLLVSQMLALRQRITDLA